LGVGGKLRRTALREWVRWGHLRPELLGGLLWPLLLKKRVKEMLAVICRLVVCGC